jgi:hypothetical protein
MGALRAQPAQLDSLLRVYLGHEYAPLFSYCLVGAVVQAALKREALLFPPFSWPGTVVQSRSILITC